MKKRNLFTFIRDNMWLVFMCLMLLIINWILTYESPVYKFTVKVTFCDNRPERIVEDYSMLVPGINNTRFRESGEILPKYEFTSKDGHDYSFLNVCELTIIKKQFLGKYSLLSNPY